MGSRRDRNAWLAGWIALAIAAPAWTAPQLIVPPPGEPLGPGSAIAIELGDLPDPVVDRSYLLLDDVDVTDFAILEGTRVTLRLPSLEPGEHRLELVELLPDGSASTRASWVLRGPGDATFDSRYLNANLSQGVEVRVADGDLDRAVDEMLQPIPESERVTADGSAWIEAGASREALSLQAQAPLLWNSEEDRLAGHHGEIGPWRVGLDAGPASLRLGHHRVGPTTLVMDAFDRRGASGSLRAARLRTRVTGFAFHGSPVVGFEDGVGLGDSDDRVYGAQLETRLLENRLGSLDVTATWLDGEAPEEGSDLSGVAGDPFHLDGQAWSVRGRTLLLEGRLDASAEYAWSRSRIAGGARQTDDAHFIGASLQPLPPDAAIGEFPIYGFLRADQSDVGTWFQSPASPGLPQDRWQLGGGAEFSVAGLWLTASGARREDNVENSPLRPTLRSESWSFVASFTPELLLRGRRPGPLAILGMPTLRYQVYWEGLSPEDLPPTYLLPEVLPDRITRDHYLGLSFLRQSFGWSFGYAHTEIDDRSTSSPSSTLDRVEATLSLYALPRLQLHPRVQYEWEHLQGLPDEETLLVGAQLDVGLLPGVVHGYATASYNRRTASGPDLDGDWVDASGSIRWNVWSARRRRPGLQLSLRGSYQRVRDDALAVFDRDVYQVFVRATLGWSALLGWR